ncbi:MAG: hypothetical protein FWD19_06250, partial [Defluviitaleaceae bacterium]|nr:hypothetical protein [Defluviitaleaceae bacterium]
GIPLGALPQLKPGDRITVTGRVPRESPAGSWGVALIIEESASRRAEECQLAQVSSPKSLFSLSYILCKEDLKSLITIQTTRWGATNPTMDLYIDSILISREEKFEKISEDPREIIFSFSSDENFQNDADITDSSVVTVSGTPKMKIFAPAGEKKSLQISGRTKDWDGVDVHLDQLKLVAGNKYKISARGKIDGTAPEGTVMTLQGLPSYSWRGSQGVSDGGKFSLCHTLSRTEVSQWTTCRITTNSIGATASFFIFEIEIKRLGLL